MNRNAVCVAGILALVLAASRPGNAETRLRVNVSPGPQHLALYVAQEHGQFAKRGLCGSFFQTRPVRSGTRVAGEFRV